MLRVRAKPGDETRKSPAATKVHCLKGAMPSFKYRSESDSEPDEEEPPVVEYQHSVLSDVDEQGPDDTFHFRSSFSKAQRPHHQQNDSFMNDTSFQETSFQSTEGEENMEQSYDTMQDDYLSDEDSLISEEEESEFVDHDPLAAAVRIEKKGTWLEQIEYTDRAVKRLKAIDVREAQQNTRIHWGGVIPDIKYSTEDLERDLFGDSKKKKFEYLSSEALKQGIFDQKSWDEKEKGKVNPAFRIRWGPGGEIIHRPSRRRLEDGTIEFTKLHLSALEKDAAQRQAQSLLERQLEHTTFTTTHSGIPVATPSASLHFNVFSHTSSLHSGQIRQIDEYESHLWTLSSILFDDIPPSTTDNIYRKRALSNYFKELVSRSVWNDLSRTRDPSERIFLNLAGYRIQDACSDATKNKDFHLATLLSLAEESSQEFRLDIRAQLDVWRKDGSQGDIQVWYRAVYELLAGQIDGPGTTIGQLGMGKKMDWRRAFAMRLWFGIPSDGEIKHAVQEYWMACQQDGNVAKPFPWYINNNDTSASLGIYDGLFQLLRLYSGSDINTTLDDALNPSNFSNTVTDVRISWHLYIILSELKRKASFADVFGAKANVVSDSGERLTLAYVSQLESLDLWRWAVYVALHLRRENTRKGVIMDIFARHIHTIHDNVEEQGIISQLVDQWKIPMEWILEAKALYARNQGDHLTCAKNLVLAKSLAEAQKTILMHIAPQAVISTHISSLEDLLLMFDTHPTGWEIGGQIYLDYISLIQDHSVGERRRRGSGSRRDSVVRLLRNLPAMEARTFEQNVAQSEMARTVANIVVSTAEMVLLALKALEANMQSKEIGGLMRLPLLEGDALRITRKVAGGMLDQVLAG